MSEKYKYVTENYVSLVEKSVVLKYKFKHLDLFAFPLEIHNDIDVECFLFKCSRIESRSPLCVNFVDKLLP